MEPSPKKTHEKRSYFVRATDGAGRSPRWTNEQDERLLELVAAQGKASAKDVDWKALEPVFRQHQGAIHRRYRYLCHGDVFTRAQEDRLVDEATRHFDEGREPDWAAVAAALGKDARACEQRYYRVMAEYWDDASTARLVELIEAYKARGARVDWDAVGRELAGRPRRVCMQRYSRYLEERKRK